MSQSNRIDKPVFTEDELLRIALGPGVSQHDSDGVSLSGEESGSQWSSSEGSVSDSCSSIVSGADAVVPSAKRQRGSVDSGEAHLRRGGSVPSQPQGSAVRRQRLGEITSKLGYWIDQLSVERRHWAALYAAEERTAMSSSADSFSQMLDVLRALPNPPVPGSSASDK